jgi:hypothetical protein
MRKRLMAATWVGAVGTAGALLSACGTASTIDPVARAASVSTAAPGFTMKLSMQLSGSGLPTTINGTGSGAFDVRDHAGALQLDMKLPSSPQLVAVLGSSTLHFEVIERGLTMYMKLPAGMSSKLPGARPWMKLDLSKAAASAGLSGLTSLASNPVSSDPSQLLQYLRATGKVSDAGIEQVDGRTTTHYAATVQLDKVADAVPAAQRQAVKQASATLERLTGQRSLPVDVWVDSAHLVRRYAMAFDENLPTGQAMSIRMTMDIPTYGPQRAPAVPPASQVLDATALAAQGLKAG